MAHSEITTKPAPPTPSIQSSDKGRVILWTSPRCCSSIFERSIRELPTVKCLYEPHLFPFIFSNNLRKLEDIDPKMVTYEFAEQSLLANYEGYDYVFAKDMAAYVPKEQFSKFTEGRFTDFKHTFLIRKPPKSVPSRWKACLRCGSDSFKRNNPDFGYSELFELFEFIRSTGRDVTVIDADDLLKNPEYIMEQYCHQTGLPYDRKMLTWTPGEVKDWTVSKYYKEWHWNAMYSSGFGNLPSVPNTRSQQSSETIPDFVEEIIQKSILYYEAMYKYRIKLP